MQLADVNGPGTGHVADDGFGRDHPALALLPEAAGQGDGVGGDAGPGVIGQPLVVPELVGVVPLEKDLPGGVQLLGVDQGLGHLRLGGLHQVEFFLKDLLADDVFVMQVVEHEGHVDVVVVQDAVQLCRLVGAHVQVHDGVGSHQLPVKGGQQRHVDAVGAAHREQHPVPAALQQPGLLPKGEHPLSDGDELRPLWGQLDLLEPLAAGDERKVQLLFQHLEPVADGGLGEKQGLCGFGDALCVDDGQKHFHIGQIHRGLPP